MTFSRTALTLASATLLALPLAACGDDPGDGSGQSGAAGGDTLEVVAAFYPLQFLTERVAGDHAEVTTLTGAGVDPHDVELTPKQVGGLGQADLVVFESGMQPVVDETIAQQAKDSALDVTEFANLMPAGEHDHEDEHEDEAAATNDDEHAHEDEHGHDHGGIDPHFWLDPERYGDVATAIGERLATIDPAHADDYKANAAALVKDLMTLDQEFKDGLADCEHKDVVTTHEAFGYLGARYDLHVVGITGISPESEPSPARLAEVAATVKQVGATTIFTEPLLPKGISETVAHETGTKVLPLDPAEGITDGSAGKDYLEVMRANLTTLQQGLGCR